MCGISQSVHMLAHLLRVLANARATTGLLVVGGDETPVYLVPVLVFRVRFDFCNEVIGSRLCEWQLRLFFNLDCVGGRFVGLQARLALPEDHDVFRDVPTHVNEVVRTELAALRIAELFFECENFHGVSSTGSKVTPPTWAGLSVVLAVVLAPVLDLLFLAGVTTAPVNVLVSDVIPTIAKGAGQTGVNLVKSDRNQNPACCEDVVSHVVNRYRGKGNNPVHMNRVGGLVLTTGADNVFFDVPDLACLFAVLLHHTVTAPDGG